MRSFSFFRLVSFDNSFFSKRGPTSLVSRVLYVRIGTTVTVFLYVVAKRIGTVTIFFIIEGLLYCIYSILTIIHAARIEQAFLQHFCAFIRMYDHCTFNCNKSGTYLSLLLPPTKI